MTFAHLENI